MRPLLLPVLLLCACAARAETYRWVEKVNGTDVVHYSDLPREGAQVVHISGGSVVASQSPPAPAAAPASAPAGAAAPFRYDTCAITQPAAEQSMLELKAVAVQANLVPSKRDSDQLFFVVDGTTTPSPSLSYSISPIARGEHTVSLIVRDAGGNLMCQSPVVRFYIQQPSVLRPPAPR